MSPSASGTFRTWCSRVGILKRSWVVDGVRYRERSGIPLKRALREPGPGVKEFDVRFPVGDRVRRRSMKIRYTPRRMYHDVGFDPRVALYRSVIERVKPGHRVLELACGTGAGSSMLAHAVGPSGGLVAIDRDGESIRFARQRYPSDHTSFELGWIETLSGEIDDGFDALFMVDPLSVSPDDPQRARDATELVRVVRPGAFVLLVVPDREGLEGSVDRFEAAGLERSGEPIQCSTSAWVAQGLIAPQRASDARARLSSPDDE